MAEKKEKQPEQTRPKSVFDDLNSINVNEHTEKKESGKDRYGNPVLLTYLSWAYAWAEVMKRYPDSNYVIERFGENRAPYFYDENLGYMCHTSMTIDGIEREMWLPVMDSTNNAMKAKPYTIKTRYGEKTIAAATMFDINKTLMRCLVKNIGMFGLGLYIYAGEDLPESEKPQEQTQQPQQTAVAYTGAQLKQALSDLEGCSTRADIDALWKRLGTECPTLLAKGGEFYNAVGAKVQQIANQQ